MTITLAPLATARLTVNPDYQMITKADGSTRIIAEISDAQWSGERLTARQKGAASADWATIGSDGVGRIDVRSTLETHDGALIYVTYQGRVKMQEDGMQVLRIAPLFETGDARYDWLNAVQAIGRGQVVDGVLQYDMFEVC